MHILNKKGFSHIAIILLIAVAVGIGFIGNSIYSRQSAVDSADVLASTSKKPLVAVFGDSLITQAHNDLVADLSGDSLYWNSYPGVAACFYLNTAVKYAQTHRAKAAILEFWGNDNSTSTCMTSKTMDSPSYFAQYKSDLEQMVKAFVKSDAHVFIVGTIPEASQVSTQNPLWDHLNDIYSAIANSYSKKDVTFVNVQSVIETSTGQFTWYLPCTSQEVSTSECGNSVSTITNPPASGYNVVRSSDGLHFCPEFLNFPTSTPDWFYYDYEYCGYLNSSNQVVPVYSSGESRYAAYIAQAVNNYINNDLRPRFIGPALPAQNTIEKAVPGQVDPYNGLICPETAAGTPVSCSQSSN